MALISGAEALVRCLIEEGVKYVFGVPGDQCNPITDAIFRLGGEKGMKFVTARHEEAAAHMADAWARVTGEPGVCLGTVGPGVANLVPGVYTAWADSVPIVVLGAQNQTWRIYPEHGSMQSLEQILAHDADHQMAGPGERREADAPSRSACVPLGHLRSPGSGVPGPAFQRTVRQGGDG